jgi:excisionase family DNA binding protein
MKTVSATGSVSPAIVAWQSLADDPLLTVRDLAERLGADVSTIRRWVSQGKLSAFRVGGKLRIRTSTALRFMGEGDHA